MQRVVMKTKPLRNPISSLYRVKIGNLDLTRFCPSFIVFHAG